MYRLSAFYVARTASDLPMVRPATAGSTQGIDLQHAFTYSIGLPTSCCKLTCSYSNAHEAAALLRTAPSPACSSLSCTAWQHSGKTSPCAVTLLVCLIHAAVWTSDGWKGAVLDAHLFQCRRTAGGFFANWAANMLVQLVAQAFGLLIGATVMDPKAAQVGHATRA